jgi:hypothetical protein
MANFAQLVVQQLLFPEEMNLAASLYGCKRPPSLLLCGMIRTFYETYHSWPGLEELVIYHYVPCQETCEYSLLFEDVIPILMHGIQEYGTMLSCSMIYMFHMYQLTEGRYPRNDELEVALDDTISTMLTETMHQQVDEFWENQKSGIDLSGFPTTIVTEEMEKESDMECAICQEGCKTGQQVLTLPCQHVFHTKSESCGGIDTWLERINSCPLCKKVINEEK